MKRFSLWIVLPGLLACVQCSEVNGPARQDEIRPPLVGLIVSGPALPGGVATSATRDGGVTYVSLRPGTLPLALRLEIRNRTLNGAPISIPTVDGGFDPVPIQANANDRLDVTVFEPNGTATAYSMTVPKRRPPTIVRTNPPKGRTDVAFSVRPAIVFSEPIDAGTLTTTSVRLLENGVLVPGTVALGPGNTWTGEFTPAAQLKPSTTYQLLITQDVRDLDGDALEESTVVEFTTAPVPFDVNPTGRIAFVARGWLPGSDYVYVANHDGSGLKRLPGGVGWYSRPRWSPDGRRIAVGIRIPEPLSAGVFVIDVDGAAGWTKLGDGWDPAWSPDGRKIVFTWSGGLHWARVGIYVMNADGTDKTRLTDPNDPAQCTEGSSASDHRPDWSPDGSRILFERQFHTDDVQPDCGLDGWGYFPKVHVLNADGTGLRQLLPLHTTFWDQWDAEPAWSPDGASIAYVSTCCGGLTLIDSEGVSPARSVFTRWDYGGRGHMNPVWSPEGKHLLFLSVDPPTNRLFIVELATGIVRPLHFPTVPGLLLDPAWGRAP